MSVDGIKRTDEQENELAAHIAVALGTPAGKKLLEYMKTVSTNRVMPTTGTSEALWHLEGQRHMVFLINHWMEKHHERHSTSSGSGDGRNASARRKRAKPATSK